jgi:hypothetical protein
MILHNISFSLESAHVIKPFSRCEMRKRTGTPSWDNVQIGVTCPAWAYTELLLERSRWRCSIKCVCCAWRIDGWEKWVCELRDKTENGHWREETEVLGEEPVLMQHCMLQIQCGLLKVVCSGFNPEERLPGILWMGAWMDPQAGLDATVKRNLSCSFSELNPNYKTLSPLLNQLSCSGSHLA